MRIGIIGAGAAGMMCAATLAEHSDFEHKIYLIDRNNGLGKKVLISGGGRCNVTTGLEDVKMILKRYPRGGKFLSHAMYAFSPKSVRTWFESQGVALKIEEDLRVFPVSDHGEDIVHVFHHLYSNSHIRVLLDHAVTHVSKTDCFHLTFKNGDILSVDVLVLTTGGQAYRQTGSQGDGYAFALQLGHTITPLAPSLSSFFTQEKWPAKLSGISFEQAVITAHTKTKSHFTGPFLFTHKGVSGPAIFALSSLVAFTPVSPSSPLFLSIDLSPNKNHDTLRIHIQNSINDQPQKQIINVLSQYFVYRVCEVVCEQLQINPTKKSGELSKKDLNRFIDWIKAVPLHVIQRGAGDEFVTAGGIPLSEVNPNTMESLVCNDLYLAGELLDIDGFTGGYNLQASWCTGRLAGSVIATKCTLHRVT